MSTQEVQSCDLERMMKMLQIGMTVKVPPDAEYNGKYTGYIGVEKKLFGSTIHAEKTLGTVIQVQ